MSLHALLFALRHCRDGFLFRHAAHQVALGPGKAKVVRRYTSTLSVAGRFVTSNSSPWGTMVIWPYSWSSIL